MKITEGDLWNLQGWKVITTNCSINRDGQAVMGRGTAHQAALKFPGLKNALGKLLKQNREPYVHVLHEYGLICFPVKKRWMDQANLGLIRIGLQRLSEIADELKPPIYLPLLGCGFGELTPARVRPLLKEFLDDRFVLVLRGESVTERYPYSFRESRYRQDKLL